MQIASTLPQPTFICTDEAADRAAINFASNCAALAEFQPKLAGKQHAIRQNLSWIFARDGSLTAMLDGTGWWAGCSVPMAAARFMLKAMDVRGVVGCFLNPSHAGQLRVALDLLTIRQAIVAIIPDDETFAVLLHAEDFSKDIAAARLWFATGTDWETELGNTFKENCGLPTPVEFIRPITADPEQTNVLIDPAQRIFSQVTVSRTAELRRLRDTWSPRRPAIRRICLLAPSDFHLWDDAAVVLAGLDFHGAGIEICRLDSDRPTSSSPMALALMAADCDAVLAANIFRSHLPDIIPDALPWITWSTTGRIPPAAEVGRNDRLLLASPSWLANVRQLGWDEARVKLAAWPAVPVSICQNKQQISIVADTQPLSVPAQIEQYSSQVLLWESIREELLRDPFLAVQNVDAYLKSRRARFQIGDDGFEPAIFIERLIIPAVQQGLTGRLIRERVPIKIFGRGWDKIEGISEFHEGLVTSREQLAGILSKSLALLNLWPWYPGHAIEMAGCPMIRANRAHDFLSDVRQALNGMLQAPAKQQHEISPDLVILPS